MAGEDQVTSPGTKDANPTPGHGVDPDSVSILG